MQEWWETLVTFEKIFWYIAVPFSVILLIQTILTFVGMGGSSVDMDDGLSDGVFDPEVDIDIDIDAEASDGSADIDASDGGLPFAVFTFRNFVAFFAVFGWAGIAGIHADFSQFWTLVFATGLGLVMMLLVSLLFYGIGKLADTGTMDIRNAIGQVGNVYIPIQASSGNIGKIQVNIQDSIREMRAVTKKDLDLPTGTVVKVTGVISGSILLVEKFV
jgi:hypothetical protein